MGLLFGCSGQDSNSDRSSYDTASEEAHFEIEMADEAIVDPSTEQAEQSAPDADQLDKANRKIIYQAYLDLEVKQYPNVIQNIEETVTDMDGYLVSNHTSRLENQLHQGNLVLRIPQETLDSFFNFLENHDQISINQRNLTGEDVTDQYIDLETRLKAREQLEERLLSFMEEAKTTKDLLSISNDLADVQYEIEQIKGQMNYIENRSDLATVELHLIEQEAELAHNKNLNVWARVKEQWLNNYNHLLIGLSNLFVIVVGNIPILILVCIVGWLFYRIYRKRKHKRA